MPPEIDADDIDARGLKYIHRLQFQPICLCASNIREGSDLHQTTITNWTRQRYF
jgi:hypothetical protein